MLTILVTPVPLNREFWEQPLQSFNLVSGGGRWSVSVYSTLFPIDIECRVYGEPITDRELGGAGAGLLPALLAKTWLLSPLSSVSAFYRLPITRDPALSHLGHSDCSNDDLSAGSYVTGVCLQSAVHCVMQHYAVCPEPGCSDCCRVPAVDHEAMMRNIDTVITVRINKLWECVVLWRPQCQPASPSPASANSPDLNIKLGQGQPRPRCVWLTIGDGLTMWHVTMPGPSSQWSWYFEIFCERCVVLSPVNAWYPAIVNGTSLIWHVCWDPRLPPPARHPAPPHSCMSARLLTWLETVIRFWL